MCSLKIGLWLLKYTGRPTPKNVIKWSRKTATDIITPQIIGEQRERERERKPFDQSTSHLV